MIYSQYVDLSNIHQSTGNFLSFVTISIDFLYAGQKARYITGGGHWFGEWGIGGLEKM